MTFLWIFLIFLIGMGLVAVEAVTPWGVAGALGIGLILYSGWLAVDAVGPKLGAIYCLMALGAAGVLMRTALRTGVEYMQLKPPGRAAAMKAAAGGPGVGEIARVVQPLRPTGTIEWNSKRYPARAISPELEFAVGSSVRIRERDSVFYLVEAAGEPEPDSDSGSVA